MKFSIDRAEVTRYLSELFGTDQIKSASFGKTELPTATVQVIPENFNEVEHRVMELIDADEADGVTHIEFDRDGATLTIMLKGEPGSICIPYSDEPMKQYRS